MLWNINPISELKNTHTYNHKFYVMVCKNNIHVTNTHKQTTHTKGEEKNSTKDDTTFIKK